MSGAPADFNSSLRSFIWHRTKVSKVLRAINLQSWLDLLQYSAVLLNRSQIQAFICSLFYSFSPSKLLLSLKYFPKSFCYQIYGVFCKFFPILIHFALSTERGERAKVCTSVYFCAQNEAWDGMAWKKPSLKCSFLAISFSSDHCSPFYSYNQIIIIIWTSNFS